MKKIILFFISLFIYNTSTIFAQDETLGRKTAEQRTEIITKNLVEKLVLTDAQTEEIHDLVLKREKLRDAGKLSDDRKKKIKADIHKVLSTEQRKLWKDLQKEKL